ncbi:hypothetical protein A4X06_0g8597 [Tilletia controversa]|uniref:Uncharacterized protein n=1 Tax=Tilletia controversa TaxID=13291 RepID=A0A8X7SSL3_9BASI|nr:hypothetical protein A4X06_0g8597 [Tilletia controversa]
MDEKVFYEMMNNFDFTAALEPTASQQVLATLSGDVREALSAAYRTIKTATSAGLRPDFAAIQRDYFHRAPADMQRAVIDALRQYFVRMGAEGPGVLRTPGPLLRLTPADLTCFFALRTPLIFRQSPQLHSVLRTKSPHLIAPAPYSG